MKWGLCILWLLTNIQLLVGPQLALAFTIVSLGYTAYSALNNAYNLYNESNKNDEGVRNRYNESITKLFDEKYKEKIAKIHENNQYIDDELARKISQERAEIKDAHQEKTSFIGKFGIALHNLWNYWKVGNHTYDDFIKKGKTPEEIAYSSFKTDDSDLGLANNGFGEKIKIWLRSQKSDNEMYPEFISDAFLSCFRKSGFDPCRKSLSPAEVKMPTASDMFDFWVAYKKKPKQK